MGSRRATTVCLAAFLLLYAPVGRLVWHEGVGDVLRALGQRNTLGLLLGSSGLAALSAAFSTVTGLALALLLFKVNIGFPPRLSFLFLLPLAVPPFVYVELLLYLSEVFGRDLFVPQLFVALVSLIYLPIPLVVLGTGIRAFEGSYEEAGRLLGGQRALLLRLILPWLRPYLLSAFSLTFIFAFSHYELASLMNVRTYTLRVFNQFSAYYNYRDALTLLVPVVIVLTAVLAVHFAVMGARPFLNAGFRPSRLLLVPTRAARLLGWTLTTILLAAMVLPLVILVSRTGNPAVATALAPGLLPQVLYSLLVATGAAVPAVLLALGFAQVTVFAGPRMRNVLMMGAVLPLALPPALIALSMVPVSAWLSAAGPSGATASLLHALVLRYFPVVCALLYAHAAAIPRSLLESSSLLGASWLRTFVRVWLPLNAAAAARALFVFVVLALGEVGIVLLLAPPDSMTAALNIYSMLHYGFGKEVAVETALVLAVVAVSALLLLGVGARRSPIPWLREVAQ